jgi:shikimate dehydrogenase
MRSFGLIGYPLSHSFSKKYFTEKFRKEGLLDCQYENYPIEDISLLPALISKNLELIGLNVTIPYKQKVISYLNELDGEAEKTGAVNTVRITRNQDKTHLKGYNTDIFGFLASIKPYIKENHRQALVIGTGGASRAVARALESLGIKVIYVSRSPRTSEHVSYSAITRNVIMECQLIINTSPIGMYPDVDACPDIPYQYLTCNHLLYDLIYNPAETIFLARGKEMGTVTLNGLQMLQLQAEKAWEIWNLK